MCPRCGEPTLSIYYEEGTDQELGALCENCKLKGTYINDKLIALAA